MTCLYALLSKFLWIISQVDNQARSIVSNAGFKTKWLIHCFFAMDFKTSFPQIQNLPAEIDPVAYGRTRNFLNGAVTRLSPYLSRGVITTRQILDSLVHRGFTFGQCETLVKELAWRDYFQRVWQERNIDEDLRNPQQPIVGSGVCAALVNAGTGIAGIDKALYELFETGYMHNHARMYTASLQCNIGQRSWKDGARWMFYHLLDGDWASNACSWQWVAGAFSSKKYYANQENINRYTGNHQHGTFLDVPYELFPHMKIPNQLDEAVPFRARTNMPESDALPDAFQGKVFIYNYYHLDPQWHSAEEGLRILLLEPDVFDRYPVSDACIRFVLELGRNIPGLIVRAESFGSLKGKLKGSDIHYREHPTTRHYEGLCEQREWMCEDVSGYYPSFFGYWKRLERFMRARFRDA